jgi:NADPH:quinone reductase-like Zn-dependent oxidoreductase
MAYVYTGLGGPEVETFTELPRPVPGPGQLLVKVRAAGVNPADWKQRTGYRPGGAPAPELPAVFGNEAAGVVEEVGEGVDGFAAGDEVFGNPATGAFAEYTLFPLTSVAHKPAGVSWTDAATLAVAPPTAYDALRQLDLPKGATLVVNGAGGGVGVATVQLARPDGLTVIGVASAAKKDFLESLGAVHVASGPGVADRVKAAAPGGIDAVFDLIGGDPLREVADVLTDRSRLVSAADRATVAELGGAPVRRNRTPEVLDAVAALVADGALDPQVTATFPFADAGLALRAVEDGHARGKIVIEFDQ